MSVQIAHLEKCSMFACMFDQCSYGALKILHSFGNLNLLVPDLEVLEIWENPIKSPGYLHFGNGDLIFHNKPNVYLALILFFSPQLILGPSLPT
jgi:hypothetical protein